MRKKIEENLTKIEEKMDKNRGIMNKIQGKDENLGKIGFKFEHSRGDIMMISKYSKGTTTLFCMFYYEKQASGGDWDLGKPTLLQ